MQITLPLKKMSRNDKLRAMEELWADLSANDARIDSPPWHAEALKETERLVKAGKIKFTDWDQAKAILRRKVVKLA